MNKSNGMKIVVNGNRRITRKELFENKDKFHQQQAKLSFEEKIKILDNLQKIADTIRITKIK